MNILHNDLLSITNLTSTPLEDIESKLNAGIDGYIADSGAPLSAEKRAAIIESFGEGMDETLSDIKAVDLREFIDNLIVNTCYYTVAQDGILNSDNDDNDDTPIKVIKDYSIAEYEDMLIRHNNIVKEAYHTDLVGIKDVVANANTDQTLESPYFELSKVETLSGASVIFDLEWEE